LAFLHFAKRSLPGGSADFRPLVAALLELIDVESDDSAGDFDPAASAGARVFVLQSLLVESPPCKSPHELGGLKKKKNKRVSGYVRYLLVGVRCLQEKRVRTQKEYKSTYLFLLVVHGHSLGRAEREGLSIPADKLDAVSGVHAVLAESAKFGFDDHFFFLIIGNE